VIRCRNFRYRDRCRGP